MYSRSSSPASGSLLDRLGLTSELKGGIGIGGADTDGLQRRDLVAHQSDQRGDHDPGARAREIMVAVISNKHWRGLGKATGLSEKLEMIGPMLDVDLSTEGGRFEAREAIDAVLRPWFAAHTVAEAATALANAGVLQGEFPDLRRAREQRSVVLTGEPAVRRHRAARGGARDGSEDPSALRRLACCSGAAVQGWAGILKQCWQMCWG